MNYKWYLMTYAHVGWIILLCNLNAIFYYCILTVFLYYFFYFKFKNVFLFLLTCSLYCCHHHRLSSSNFYPIHWDWLCELFWVFYNSSPFSQFLVFVALLLFIWGCFGLLYKYSNHLKFITWFLFCIANGYHLVDLS